jgi:hypothetical protein
LQHVVSPRRDLESGQCIVLQNAMDGGNEGIGGDNDLIATSDTHRVKGDKSGSSG